MARLTFRQGIVRHGKSPGQPFFLQQNGNFVDLLISPDLTIIAFADSTKDYLFTESVTQNSPWGPFNTPTQDYWLYWDLNKVTGTRTHGSTTLAPVNATIAPSSPTVGQMWFDTSTGNFTSLKMHEWNGASWVHVLRVLACRYNNNIFYSPVDGVSIETNFTGSQIGSTGNVTRNIGSLAFDASGKPIINQDGKFFTTEDIFTTGVPTGASLKVNNILLRAQASVNIAAFQVVVFGQYNKITLASPFDFLDKVYGIVEEDVVINAVGNVLTEGVIFNELWDFTDTINNPDMSGDINDPIYITVTGELTTNISLSIPGQVPLGAIIGIQSILFSPGLYGTSGFGTVNDHGNLTGLGDDDHPQYHDDTRGDLRYYAKATADLLFAPLTHAHTRSDITDFAHLHVEADIQDLDKYSQVAVDNLLIGKVSISGDTMTGSLILNADPTLPLGAVTKQYADAIAAGIDAKESVAVATINDIGGTYSPTAGTGGTGEFTGVDVANIDGIEGVDYDFILTNRVLIKNQLDAKQNGIYVITSQVAGPNSILERATDHDGTPASEVSPGNYTFVNGGSTQSGGGWVVLAGTATGPSDTIILNTDDMNWSAVSSATAYTADGTTTFIDGSNVISVIPASTGGQVDALTWNGESNTITAAAIDQVLIYNAANDWRNDYLSVIRDTAGTSNVTVNTTNGNVDVASTAVLTLNSAGNTSITSSLAIALNSTGNTTITAGTSSILLNNATDIILTSDNVIINPTTGNGTIILNSGGFNTTFTTPSLAASTLFMLPATNGTSGEILSTDGTGITSWIPAPSGGGGSSVCLQDGDDPTTGAVNTGDTYISVGFNGTPCTDSGNNLIRLQAGDAQSAGVTGGEISMFAGVGNGARSGNISLVAGYGTSPSTLAGSVGISGGTGYGNPGGDANFNGGDAFNPGGTGGSVNIAAGQGYGNGLNTAGNVIITGGSVYTEGFAAATNTGDVQIRTRSATGKYGVTGDIYLTPGGQYADSGIGDPSNQGNIIIGRNGNNTYTNGNFMPQLQFRDVYGTNYTSFTAPLIINKSVVMTLPGDSPAVEGQVLIVNQITTQIGSPDLVDLAWGGIPYDVVGQGVGVLNDGDVILRFRVARTINFEGVHIGSAETAPSGTAADFQVSTQSVPGGAVTTIAGLITFQAGTQTTTSGVSPFVAPRGTVITLTCINANSIADVNISLVGIMETYA